MGVMGCHRNGCENVLCYRLSHKYGYICSDCLKDLIGRGIKTDISEFMASEKPDNGGIIASDYFDGIFMRCD